MAIRALRVTRTSAVEARTQAFNTLFGVMVGAPSPLRDDLVDLTKRTRVHRCLRLRPETDDLGGLLGDPDRLLLAATKTSLRDVARRWKQLDDEVKRLDRQIAVLVTAVTPRLVALHGVGVEIAGQFLVTAGDNAHRIRSEAAFAKLCGAAPQPASSGRTSGRHRLSRGGDRAANSALYMVAIVRLRRHGPTRAYVERRTAEGLTKREIIRCLKRYIAREICANLPRPEAPPPPRYRAADKHGSIERLNRTLAAEWAYAADYPSDATREATCADWLHHDNHHRPNTGIGGLTPSGTRSQRQGELDLAEAAACKANDRRMANVG